MKGLRLLASSEVKHCAPLNEALVKSLTGDDGINARHPYGRPFSFVPVGKIFLRVNKLPTIHDQSHGMWRRVKVVPFLETFENDNTLACVLANEAEGILAWAIRGCLDWQREGLQHPAIVDAMTQEYRLDSDTLQQFLDASCVIAASTKVPAQKLWNEYSQWCDSLDLRKEERLSQREFGRYIRARFDVIEGRTVTYVGVGLKEAEGVYASTRF